jgi:Cyclic-phosphate processing Receiver domain
MTWRLFLDDNRNAPVGLMVARSFREAKDLVLSCGCPEYISFDFYLSDGELTGVDFAKWLIQADTSNRIQIAKGFEFDVHSSSPDGAAEIHETVTGYLSSRK